LTVSAKDFVTLVESVLSSGTWTNYGSTPGIYARKDIERRRGKKDTRITVTNDSDRPSLAFDGTVVVTQTSGVVKIWTRNASDQANLELDLKAILKASDYPFSITGVTRRDTLDRREVEYRIQVLW